MSQQRISDERVRELAAQQKQTKKVQALHAVHNAALRVAMDPNERAAVVKPEEN